jgi:hypothetical protein
MTVCNKLNPMNCTEMTIFYFLVSNVTKMCLEKSSSTMKNDEQELTKSVTERFLTTLNIPTCKCSTTKLQTTNTNLKHSFMDDNITCMSLENDSSISSSSTSKKKKRNPTSIKRIVPFLLMF